MPPTVRNTRNTRRARSIAGNNAAVKESPGKKMDQSTVCDDSSLMVISNVVEVLEISDSMVDNLSKINRTVHVSLVDISTANPSLLKSANRVAALLKSAPRDPIPEFVTVRRGQRARGNHSGTATEPDNSDTTTESHCTTAIRRNQGSSSNAELYSHVTQRTHSSRSHSSSKENESMQRQTTQEDSLRDHSLQLATGKTQRNTTISSYIDQLPNPVTSTNTTTQTSKASRQLRSQRNAARQPPSTSESDLSVVKTSTKPAKARKRPAKKGTAVKSKGRSANKQVEVETPALEQEQQVTSSESIAKNRPRRKPSKRTDTVAKTLPSKLRKQSKKTKASVSDNTGDNALSPSADAVSTEEEDARQMERETRATTKRTRAMKKDTVEASERTVVTTGAMESEQTDALEAISNRNTIARNAQKVDHSADYRGTIHFRSIDMDVSIHSLSTRSKSKDNSRVSIAEYDNSEIPLVMLQKLCTSNKIPSVQQTVTSPRKADASSMARVTLRRDKRRDLLDEHNLLLNNVLLEVPRATIYFEDKSLDFTEEALRKTRSTSRSLQNDVVPASVVSPVVESVAPKEVRRKLRPNIPKKTRKAVSPSSKHEDTRQILSDKATAESEKSDQSKQPDALVCGSTAGNESVSSVQMVAKSTRKHRGREHNKTTGKKSGATVAQRRIRTGKQAQDTTCTTETQTIPPITNDEVTVARARTRMRYNSVGNESRIPVYRMPSTGLNKSKSLQQLPTSDNDNGDDVYDFLTLSQQSDSSTVSKKPVATKAKKRKPITAGSTVKAKRRPTPLKHQHSNNSVFGTNMSNICRIVKKIGGGPVKSGQTSMVRLQRSVSPVISTAASDNDDGMDHFDHAEPMETDVPAAMECNAEPSPPVVSVEPAPTTTALNFQPLGISSPWRLSNEAVIPKRTYYFSRSKDLLPSYESQVMPEEKPEQPVKVTAPPSSTGPRKMADRLGQKQQFQTIEKSYKELQQTSAMSDKLIGAMRQYKANLNQSSDQRELAENELLIAKFKEYERNMQLTYQKLKQWYERSQKNLNRSMKAMDLLQPAALTPEQRKMVENFQRDSDQFRSMLDELHSAMNDSNIENISPPKGRSTNIPGQPKPALQDVILTDRDNVNAKRSPLKSLNILPIPTRYSPLKSPLVKASYPPEPNRQQSRNLFSKLTLANNNSVIDLSETPSVPVITATNDKGSKEKVDLFGFEDDVAEESSGLSEKSANHSQLASITINKDTLRGRLQSTRKLLPLRRPELRKPGSLLAPPTIRLNSNVFRSPSKRPTSSIRDFVASTPLPSNSKSQTNVGAPDIANISAIEHATTTVGATNSARPVTQQEQPKEDSFPVVLFDDLKDDRDPLRVNTSALQRTYTRIPRKAKKRVRNMYLENLGISDDEMELSETETEPENVKPSKKRKKAPSNTAAGKRPVVQSKELQQFVEEFNSMCEEVNKYQLIVDNTHIKKRK